MREGCDEGSEEEGEEGEEGRGSVFFFVDRGEQRDPESSSSFPFLSLSSLASQSYLGRRGDAEAVAAAIHDDALGEEKKRLESE